LYSFCLLCPRTNAACHDSISCTHARAFFQAKSTIERREEREKEKERRELEEAEAKKRKIKEMFERL
jgi:hypothetical protein